MTTKRYQIKILDAELGQLVGEIAECAVEEVQEISDGALPANEVYPAVFEATKETLRQYIRGFHVCGCRAHCDLESAPTELRDPAVKAQDLGAVPFCSRRISRYVLLLEISLQQFAQRLEGRIIRALLRSTTFRSWRGHLYQAIRKAVELTLGKYIYFTPTCNRGEYICEVGVCTEFDPWTNVAPRVSGEKR